MENERAPRPYLPRRKRTPNAPSLVECVKPPGNQDGGAAAAAAAAVSISFANQHQINLNALTASQSSYGFIFRFESPDASMRRKLVTSGRDIVSTNTADE